VKDTPRNFHATIEVPPVRTSSFAKGGELVMEPITGNKDVQATAARSRSGSAIPTSIHPSTRR
jgi:hypothetical protein